MFFSFNSSMLYSNLLSPLYILIWNLFCSLDWSLMFSDYILVFCPLIWNIYLYLMWYLDLLLYWNMISVLFINIISHSSTMHFSHLFRYFLNSLGLQIVYLLLLPIFSPLLWYHFSLSLIFSVHHFHSSDSRFTNGMGFYCVVV